ncbi:FAD/NAD(P)-binding domain-containing protein [Pluteus cervinus]|uniref:FAD/NAD(P)-binding domain-containing protein n=1 Tax=Pluteus cervinus TaxID=181527 RepID=A0ACD3AN41_9AGAR|nr:FAD/NAD(P)-binding domain-containing protein [Pluteus cervinus]
MILQSLDLEFEILEANEDVGGRLYTYHFDTSKPPGGHEYFDLGAMRFPDTPMMRRTFHLFKLLGNRIKPIDYIFSNDNSILLYNNDPKQNGPPTEIAVLGDPRVQDIPDRYKRKTITDLVEYVIGPFAKALAKDITGGGREGWDLMMKYNKYSTRAYMLLVPTDPSLDPEGLLPYPTQLIDLLETFDSSTGSYDDAFTEAVLDQLAFSWPEKKPGEEIRWRCLDGGSQTLAFAMRDALKEKGLNLTTGFRVGSIALSKDETELEVKSLRNQTKKYDHVITTTTLSCLRVINLDKANLDPAQSIALRELQYGPATKIGIEFKTQWWGADQHPGMEMPFGPIQGGQSYTDRSIRMIVYPSYGEAPGSTPSRVLMVNYSWTSDALRLTGLISSGDPDALEILKDLVFRDIVAVHWNKLDPEKGYAFLQEQFVKWHPFSWVTASNTIGAYASFGPGQFEYICRYLTIPAAKGRLYFAGEVVSARHAWVVGALTASWRAIRQILLATYPGKLPEFYRMWGDNEDWSDEIVLTMLALSEEVGNGDFKLPLVWRDEVVGNN